MYRNKISTALEEIAQIYLPYLPLFASLGVSVLWEWGFCAASDQTNPWSRFLILVLNMILFFWFLMMYHIWQTEGGSYGDEDIVQLVTKQSDKVMQMSLCSLSRVLINPKVYENFFSQYHSNVWESTCRCILMCYSMQMFFSSWKVVTILFHCVWEQMFILFEWMARKEVFPQFFVLAPSCRDW